MRRFAISAVLLVSGAAQADDGYCDFVQGVAAADAAVMMAPEAFVQFGKLEQASTSILPGSDPGTTRFIGGVRWRLTGLYEAHATRARAKADCRRHSALESIRGATQHAALAARATVIEAALPEAEKILAGIIADFDARRTTAPEATAARLRVEELRRIASDTRDAMAALPAPGANSSGISAYQAADAEVEANEAKVRRARAIDISVRFGVDEYLDDSGTNTSSPLFAVVSASLNLGAIFVGRGNARAAAGRRRYVASGRDPVSVGATADRLRALVDSAQRRATETAALEQDLAKQVEALARLPGDDTKRYRHTVWFDLVKVRAERAYHQAHAAALTAVIGGS